MSSCNKPHLLPCSVNANLDLIVSATQLLEALGLSPGQPVDHTQLTSGRDLQEQVAYSMLHCAGTERVFTSEEEFKRIIRAAYQLPREVHEAQCLSPPSPSPSSSLLLPPSLPPSLSQVRTLTHTLSWPHTAFCGRQCSSHGSEDTDDSA